MKLILTSAASQHSERSPSAGGWQGPTASRILLRQDPDCRVKNIQSFLLMRARVVAERVAPTHSRAGTIRRTAAGTTAGNEWRSNTGGTFAPVLDAQKRPITAGAIVDHGPTIFIDIAEKAGLSTWTHRDGTTEKQFILETKGSGVGLIDYDNDGWLDIYLVNGSTYRRARRQSDAAACRAVPQQPRRDVYRCCGEGGRDQRPLGLRRAPSRTMTTTAGRTST